MTRDEWNQVLATEPPTGPQVGAIIGEFERLGIVDRAERLAMSAELLGLEGLGSTTDLVMGDAGRLVAMLRRTRDRGELPDVTAADGPGEDGDRMSVAETIKRVIIIGCGHTRWSLARRRGCARCGACG